MKSFLIEYRLVLAYVLVQLLYRNYRLEAPLPKRLRLRHNLRNPAHLTKSYLVFPTIQIRPNQEDQLL